jgi:C4-dicarboxylate-specific signal transduction histidine kinase
MTFNFHEIMSFTAGALQFVVAGYALRLNRLFGTTRVGWSLFGAFSLLAILHLVQSLMPSNDGAEFGVKIEVVYSLISLMLLTGMTHIETLLKERLRMEQMEKNLRGELESQVKEKTAHLTKAIEELQLEIEQRKRMEVEIKKTHQELLVASRQAGMAEIAIKVLHNVGNMLQSVNISASLVFDHVKQSKIANVVRVGALIREHTADLGDFMKHDPRGQKLPAYIAQLAEHLTNEQTVLSTELESLRKNIHEVLAIQQSYVKISGVTEIVKKPATSVEYSPDTNEDMPQNDVHNLTFLDEPLVSSR